MPQALIIRGSIRIGDRAAEADNSSHPDRAPTVLPSSVPSSNSLAVSITLCRTALVDIPRGILSPNDRMPGK